MDPENQDLFDVRRAAGTGNDDELAAAGPDRQRGARSSARPPASARPIGPPAHHHARRRQVAEQTDPGRLGKRSGTSRYRPGAHRLRPRWPRARRSARGCQSAAAQAATPVGRSAATSRTSGRSIVPSAVHWAWPTNSASCRRGILHRGRANHFALHVGQFLAETRGHRGRGRGFPAARPPAPAAAPAAKPLEIALRTRCKIASRLAHDGCTRCAAVPAAAQLRVDAVPVASPPASEIGAGHLGQLAAAGPGAQLVRMPGQELRHPHAEPHAHIASL